MTDLTKLIFASNYPAFKNKTVYEGTCTISGSTSGGLNTKTFTVTLAEEPDILDVRFNGNAAVSDPRPDDAWFKSGSISVATNNAGGGNPSSWLLSYSVSGTTVTITASYVQTFTTAETLTSTDFTYKIIDYSVF